MSNLEDLQDTNLNLPEFFTKGLKNHILDPILTSKVMIYWQCHGINLCFQILIYFKNFFIGWRGWEWKTVLFSSSADPGLGMFPRDSAGKRNGSFSNLSLSICTLSGTIKAITWPFFSGNLLRKIHKFSGLNCHYCHYIIQSPFL